MKFDEPGWRLLAPAGFTLLALAFFASTIDDSFISLRYGRNLAAGLGPVFDAQPPREAYSSPTWVVLSAIPFLLHLSADAAVTAMKGAGLAFGVLTVLLTGALARRRAGDAGAGVAGAVLLACMPWMAFWAVGGLETPLYCALLMAGLLLHEREHARERPHVGSAIAFAMMALTRPEGIAVALAALLAGPIAASVERRSASPATGRAVPGVILVCACWLAHEAWRVSYFGALLPATFDAKAGLTIHALKMRAWELLPFGIYAAPLVVAAVRGTPRNRHGYAFCGAVLGQAAFVLVPRLEGGPGFRYEVPLLPMLAAAAGAGLWTTPRATRARGTWAIAALLLFLLSPVLWLRHPSRYAPSRVEISLGRWLAAYAPDARLAVYDLGAVPYFSRAPNVLDTNPDGPLRSFPDRPYDLDALLAWSPSFVILPAEPGDPADPLAALARRADFAAGYAPLFDLDAGDGYRMTVWKRRDVMLPDGALSAAERAGLYQRRVSRSAGGRPKYS